MKTHRLLVPAFIACALFLMVAGGTPAQLSVDTDKALLEKGMSAMKSSDFVQARSLMESLINRYPDSQLVPLAKFSIADAWYEEGNYKQAETEYRDFVTFFANHPEVAEARARLESIRTKSKM
jgi:outer membrane protein assembly factor BamD (BamD/ComL family)